MKSFTIYRILDTVNRKYYIGRTTKPLKRRWSEHKSYAKHGQKYVMKGRSARPGDTYLYRAMRKYGIENFEIRQIDSAKNFQSMVYLESFYIRYYNSLNPNYGYNLTIDKYGNEDRAHNPDARLRACFAKHKRNGTGGGIGWDKSRGLWYMKFVFLDTKVCKRFASKEAAIEARDKLVLFFYKEEGVLHDPAVKDRYSREELKTFYEAISKPKCEKSSYDGISAYKSGWFNARVVDPNRKTGDDRLFIGTFKTEEEAVVARDKVLFYLGAEKSSLGRPDLFKDSYLEEGKTIYDIYSNPRKQLQRKSPKTSKYNGVNKRSKNTWEMMVMISKKRIREVYADEVSAAIAHDYYILALNGDKKRLNFPDQKAGSKPVSLPVGLGKGRKSLSKEISLAEV